MSRRRAGRMLHRFTSLAGVVGLLVLTVTGWALMHPGWFGRPTAVATVLAADPGQEGRLLRAGPFLVEESRDGGATWRDLPLGMAPAVPVACRFTPDDPRTVWLLGTTELLVSTDGGRVWDPVELPADVVFDRPARDLAITPGGAPVLTTGFQAWRLEDGAWRELWNIPPQRADRTKAWVRRLHTGHWGPTWISRLHDGVAVLTLLVIGSGLVLLARRNGRNGRNGRSS